MFSKKKDMKSLKIQDVSADCPSYIEEKKTGLTTVDEKAEGGKSGEGTESGAGGWRILKRSGTGKRRARSTKAEPEAAGENKEFSNKAEGKGEARKRFE